MRSIQHVTLASGLEVDYVLPWQRDLLIASGAAVTAVSRATAALRSNEAGEEMGKQLDSILGSAAYQEEAVRRMVRALNGIPVRFKTTEELREYLSEEEFFELAAIGTQRPLYKTVPGSSKEPQDWEEAGAQLREQWLAGVTE